MTPPTFASARQDELIETVDRLNDELTCIHDVLREIQQDVQWGIQNGRVLLVLAEPESLDHRREATVGTDVVPIALRLNAALGDLREELTAAIEHQRSEPIDASATPADDVIDEPTTHTGDESTSLPDITLFEVGDAVELDLDGEIWFGEVCELDDADNQAVIQLIPTYEEIDVPQDLLQRITPDELSQRLAEFEAVDAADAARQAARPSPGDRVVVNLHGHPLEGEVLTVSHNQGPADILLTPSMETITVDESELSILDRKREAAAALATTLDATQQRRAAHEEWCREVRNRARQHTEGRRVVAPCNGQATVEYEVAPLPNGEWAVRWRHGFWCGNFWGAAHPWTTRPTRDDCIELVLSTSRQMFSTANLDKVQQPVAREMRHLLGDGLFGFHEPEPIPDPDPRDGNSLDPSGLAAAAEALVHPQGDRT